MIMVVFLPNTAHSLVESSMNRFHTSLSWTPSHKGSGPACLAAFREISDLATSEHSRHSYHNSLNYRYNIVVAIPQLICLHTDLPMKTLPSGVIEKIPKALYSSPRSRYDLLFTIHVTPTRSPFKNLVAGFELSTPR
jgi:hypothetical protein